MKVLKDLEFKFKWLFVVFLIATLFAIPVSIISIVISGNLNAYFLSEDIPVSAVSVNTVVSIVIYLLTFIGVDKFLDWMEYRLQ